MVARYLSVAAFVAGTLGASATVASAQSYTTRIEPRPFYGATITLEEGVRVIRPLPPERQVIINPSKVPLSLGFNDTRVYENRVVRHYYSSDARGGSKSTPSYDGGGYFFPGYYLGGQNLRNRFNGNFNSGGRHFQRGGGFNGWTKPPVR
jgi:hypothetical protein